MRSVRTLAIVAAIVLTSTYAAAQPSSTFPPTAKHGGLIYVSGVLPGPALASEGFDRQLDAVLAELASRVKAAGSSLSQVVSTSVYLKSAADVPALNAAWKRHWPTAPPTRTTVVAALPAPGALVQVTAVAVPNGTDRTVVLPEGWAAPPAPWSYAIRSGNVLFMSGLVPRRGADNSRVPGDMAAQTRTILDNAKTILQSAGLSLADVVSARIFVTNVSQFQAMNEAYRSYFPQVPPARATVVAGLLHPDDVVEIALTAVAGQDRTVVTAPAADGSPGKPNPNLSSAIRVGPRLFLSGMLGLTPGKPADLAAQTAETLARLERTMTLAGYSWSNVIDCTVYVTDVSTADAVVRALRAKAGGRLPAGTVVGTTLVSPDGFVEIMLTAAKQE